MPRQSFDYMLDPPEFEECEDCGEDVSSCECGGEPDYEPDDYCDEPRDIYD